MKNAKLLSFFGGPIEIGYVDNVTRLWTPMYTKERNTILYQGADIVGRLLAGYDEYVPSTMYFQYQNTAGTPSTPSIARGDNVADFLGLTSTNDFLRVPLEGVPSLQNSDDNYEANQVLFFATTSGSVGEAQGLAFSDAANSKVVSAAIVATPTGDIEDDVIFARFNLDTHITKLASSQIGIKWMVQVP